YSITVRPPRERSYDSVYLQRLWGLDRGDSRALRLGGRVRIMGESVSVLCESCGYDLSGSTPDGVCGECGEPVAVSLPGCRTDSQRQLGEGPVALVRTILAVSTEPRSIWARLQMVMPSSFGLLVANAALAGIVYGVIV